MMGNGVHARSVYVQLKQPVISESGKTSSQVCVGLCVSVCVGAGYIFYGLGACTGACMRVFSLGGQGYKSITQVLKAHLASIRAVVTFCATLWNSG